MADIQFPHRERDYINVMESLVAQEVGKQLQHVPGKIRRYLKMEEVVTYALNRLPTLYASSQRGWQYQRQLAQRDLHRRISDVVRQAIVAVQIDPLRLAQPIKIGQNPDATAVLRALAELFDTPDLTWDKALRKLETLEQAPNLPSSPQSRQAPWQPSDHTRRVGWTSQQPGSAQRADDSPQDAKSRSEDELSGWDDAKYQL